METIFKSTKISKTSESNNLFMNLLTSFNLKNPNKNIALANLSVYYNTPKNNLHITTINLKYLLQLGMMNLIYLMDHAISDIQNYFEYIIKKHETIADNPVQIYINKIKNRIVFKIKTGYKLELLSPETMKLLGSSKKRC